MRLIFILISFFVFQSSFINVLANPINLGLNPHSPISEVYTYDGIESSAWGKSDRIGRANWWFSKSEFGVGSESLLLNIGNAAKGGFNATSFANEIVRLNKATDGGGVLLNGTPSSAINSAMYYETAAEQGSSIFRSISNGHMFVNGNKRMAVAAFLSFAKMHGLTTVSQSQMMNVATKVATGQVTDVSQIAKMLIK